MSLSDLISDDASAVFLQTDDFAQTIVFYPSGGTPREITAVVEFEPAPVEEGQSHRTRRETCLVHCLESATTGILDPGLKDAFLIDGEDADTQKWGFDTVQRKGGGMIACRFHRRSIDHQGELTPNEL